jgi:maltokinase
LRNIEATPVQPVHGDLHVGQVLRWEGGYAVNDFDGNPVLRPEERLAPQPTARDVAGMLQSLDHVGRVALRHAPDADADLVAAWIVEARARFLAAYRTTLGDRTDRLDERLLEPFAVEQECREYVYAARHLPRWVYVPDAAMPALLT